MNEFSILCRVLGFRSITANRKILYWYRCLP